MKMINKIELLMREAGLNRRQLSIKAGIPYSTVDNWFKVDCEKMQLPTFRALCDFFGVTMDSMAWDDQEIVYREDLKAPELSSEQRDVAEAYGRVDEGIQRGVRLLLKLPEGKNNTLPEEEYLKDA